MDSGRLKTRSAFTLCCALAISAWWFLSASAFGDGFFAKGFAAKKLPAIPSQRALLTYRDGAERLVIESALDGQGDTLGWIIPVPARPTEFEKASPGLLKTLSLNVQPEIIQHRRTEHRLTTSWVLAAVIALWAAWVVVFRPRAAH